MTDFPVHIVVGAIPVAARGVILTFATATSLGVAFVFMLIGVLVWDRDKGWKGKCYAVVAELMVAAFWIGISVGLFRWSGIPAASKAGFVDHLSNIFPVFPIAAIMLLYGFLKRNSEENLYRFVKCTPSRAFFVIFVGDWVSDIVNGYLVTLQAKTYSIPGGAWFRDGLITYQSLFMLIYSALWCVLAVGYWTQIEDTVHGPSLARTNFFFSKLACKGFTRFYGRR